MKFKKGISLVLSAVILSAFFDGTAFADDGDVYVDIKCDDVIHTVTERMYGLNNEWKNGYIADTYARYPGTDINKVYTYAMTDFPHPLNRMAGESANHIEWKKAIGAMSERRAQESDLFGEDNILRTGVVEWINAVKDIDPRAGFDYVVNMYSDTVENCADLVRFLRLEPEDPKAIGRDGINWAKKRVDLGIKDPVNIVCWELGNELDITTNDQPEAKFTPDKYIKMAKEYIAAIKEVDPSARICAQGAWAAPTSAGGKKWNNAIFESGILDECDYLSYHSYPGTDNTESFARSNIRTLISDQGFTSSGTKIFVSEHGAPYDYRTMDGGFGMISMRSAVCDGMFYNMMINEPYIDMAAYHCGGAIPSPDIWGVCYIDENKMIKTTLSGEVLKLFYEKGRGEAVKTSVEKTTRSWSWSTWRYEEKRTEANDSLSVGALKTDSGLNIFFVNPTANPITPDMSTDKELSVKYRTVIGNGTPGAVNYIGRHDIDIKREEIQNEDAENVYTIPAYSIVLLETEYKDENDRIYKETLNYDPGFDNLMGEKPQEGLEGKWYASEYNELSGKYDHALRSNAARVGIGDVWAGLYQDIGIDAFKNGEGRYAISAKVKVENNEQRSPMTPSDIILSAKVRYAYTGDDGKKIFLDREDVLKEIRVCADEWDKWYNISGEDFLFDRSYLRAKEENGKVYIPDSVRLELYCNEFDTLTGIPWNRLLYEDNEVYMLADDLMIQYIGTGEKPQKTEIKTYTEQKRSISSKMIPLTDDADMENIGYGISKANDVYDAGESGRVSIYAKGAEIVRYDMETGEESNKNKALKIDLGGNFAFAFMTYPKTLFDKTGGGEYRIRADVRIPHNAAGSAIGQYNNTTGEINKTYFGIRALYTAPDGTEKRRNIADARFSITEFDKLYHAGGDFTFDPDKWKTYTENGVTYELINITFFIGQYEYMTNLGVKNLSDPEYNTSLIIDNFMIEYYGYECSDDRYIVLDAKNCEEEEISAQLYTAAKTGGRLDKAEDLGNYSFAPGYSGKEYVNAPNYPDSEYTDVFFWTYEPALNNGYPSLLWENTNTDEKDIWDRTSDASWFDENRDEFYISSASQLSGLGELVDEGNDFLGKTIHLLKNIDLGGDKGYVWKSIGTKGVFSGTFDGSGHTVSNIYINAQNGGLFENLNGTVSELGIEDLTFEGDRSRRQTVGALSAKLGRDARIENSFIKNVTYIYNGDKDIYFTAGGLAGEAMGADIENTYIMDVRIEGAEDANAGGFIGIVDSGAERIGMENCFVCGFRGVWAVQLSNGTAAREKTSIINCFSTDFEDADDWPSYANGVYLEDKEELKNISERLGNAYKTEKGKQMIPKALRSAYENMR